METYTIEGWLGGNLMVEECGVEDVAVDDMIAELKEEGYSVLVFRE
jgi:biotin operon repressor